MSSPQFVDHLVFRVADLGKTERFYTTVLEQEPERADDSAMYQIGETRLFFTRCRRIQQKRYEKENVGLNHLAFGVVTVEELQSVRTRLDQAQIVHSGIRKDRYGHKDFIWLDDPDNLRIEFYFRPLS
jgi:glyoxylase I family protein